MTPATPLDDRAQAADALRREFGYTYNDLDGDRQALLAQDAVEVWDELGTVEVAPGDVRRRTTLAIAVAELSRRIGGRKNLQSYADTLAAHYGPRTPRSVP